MTQTYLLTHMMAVVDVITPAKLTQWFGDAWMEPLRNLCALGVVYVHPFDNHIYIHGWNGKSFGH